MKSVQIDSKPTVGVGAWFKRVGYTVVLMGLIASNIASLVSAPFHDMLYEAFASQLLSYAPRTASKVLANTPTTRLAAEKSKLSSAKQSIRSFKSKAVKRLVRQKVVSIATLPERVIPVVGVAVIAGATIYEINSDCQLFNDINQLAKFTDSEGEDPHQNEICGFSIPTGGVKDALEDFKGNIVGMDLTGQLKTWIKTVNGKF